MGVAEMTRFGMKETDFQTLAELMHDVIVQNKPVKSQVTTFRKRFQEMQYCFSENEPRVQKVLEAIV
jgi:glycine/serine hydroxymethyltransferase